MPQPHGRFDRIYEAHYRHVLAYCLRRVGPTDAAAAANEVMSIAWQRIEDVPTGESELPWLYGVARKVLSHHWRAVRRRGRLAAEVQADPPTLPRDPEQVVVMRIELERVLDALALLSESDQEVLRLAAWEGLSHRQIAELLECAVTTVDQRLHRAKRRLAEKYTAVDHARVLRRVVDRRRSGGAS
jgi:RNA polymerase sigma-70 factor (ECF subfamily)